MSKRLIIWILTAASIAAFGLSLWQTFQHWAWLDAHHLAGIAVMDLMALGFLASTVPYYWNSLEDTMTLGEMARDVARRSGLILLTFTGMGILFLFIGYLLSLPARMERPYLFLPSLLILLPIVLSGGDIVRGIIQRTAANLFWSWLKHSFELYYILLVQIGTIPVAFLLFPAGFFLQIISVVEEGIRLFSDKTFDSLPLLCEWTNVGAAACTPTLVSFHIGHLILAVLSAKYGKRLLDKAADWYAAGLEWLGKRIEY